MGRSGETLLARPKSLLFLVHDHVRLLLELAGQKEQDRRRSWALGGAGRKDASNGRSSGTAEGIPLASMSPGPGARQGWEREARSGTRGFWGPWGRGVLTWKQAE